ncbi:hypothetical protein CHS0354_000679 [Potamilus streckersoni]|uniref:Thioredoxin domain-containing protein n=1 Tax=Potamilus streckersoni TaxID=2493646 RepID=A0AAE0T804_9BIVA|nr:hypothetical protein CHS0354_000679 [Potamilus streckersoni]
MVKGKYLLGTIVVFGVLLSATLFFVRCKSSEKQESQGAQQMSEGRTPSNDGGTSQQSPDFELTTMDGQALKLSNLKGKLVILNFWATWCPPCIQEIPDMIKLQEKYKNDNFTFVGIAIADEIDNVKSFVAEQNVNYPIAMGTQKIVDDYGGFNAIPTTFIISKEGNIMKKLTGLIGYDEFEDIIKTKYTITFNKNGGSDVASFTVASGNKATKLTDSTRTGYTFGGWYKEEAATTMFDFETEAVTATLPFTRSGRVHSRDISSLKGSEYFVSLTKLWCDVNQLETLDVCTNAALKTLWCYSNSLATLDLKGMCSATELKITTDGTGTNNNSGLTNFKIHSDLNTANVIDKGRAELKVVKDANTQLQSQTTCLRATHSGVESSSKEAMGSPNEAMGSPNEAMGSPKEAMGSPNEAMGSPKEAMGSPNEAMGSPNEAMGSPNEAMGSPNEALRAYN